MRVYYIFSEYITVKKLYLKLLMKRSLRVSES